MRGIIAAGGKGTRLHPLTLAVNKHLLPVHDKPMIYYALTTLVRAGIREIILVSSPEDLPSFRKLFDDGSQFGISVQYAAQQEAKGIADLFRVPAVRSFVGQESVCLTLGDNVFWGEGLGETLRAAVRKFEDHTSIPHALIFGVPSKRKEEFGVMILTDGGRRVEKLIEKPQPDQIGEVHPSNVWVVPGLYMYTAHALKFVNELKPSNRGELEITDLNSRFLEPGRKLIPWVLPKTVSWADTGTLRALREVALQIEKEQERRNLLTGSPERAALSQKFITHSQFNALVGRYPRDSEYKTLLSGGALLKTDEESREHPALRQV